MAAVLVVWSRFILTITGVNLLKYFNELPLTTRQMDFTELIPSAGNDLWYYLAQPFHRFDSLWYETVSLTNYRGLPQSTAFFPLYPWIIKSFSIYLHLPFYVSAYLLNTLFTTAMLWMFYKLVSIDCNKKTALRAVIIYALFPTSFFLLAPYAESLLMLLIFTSLFFAREKKNILSAVCGFLAAMTKPYGLLVIIPLAVFAWSEKKLSVKIKRLILLLLIPIGTALVLFLQNQLAADSTLALTGGVQGWKMQIVNPLSHLVSALQLLWINPFDLPNIVNLVALAMTILFLVKSQGKVHSSYRWFVGALLVLFTCYQIAGAVPLKSFGRYFLAFFPVFNWLSRQKISPIINIIYIATSSMLMIFFFIWYTFGFFVF